MSTPFVLALIVAVLLLVYSVFRYMRYLREKRKTYAQLLAEYQVLERTINEWRHPNGVPVDWDERGKLNVRYRKAWRRVRNHPDHPQKSEQESEG
jgi:predicted membrane chloride channel (bestrophin family)